MSKKKKFRKRRGHPVGLLIGLTDDSAVFWRIFSEIVKPDIIALGYDQKHSRDSIKSGLEDNGWGQVQVIRVEGLADDLDGTRKIIARILSLWSGETGGPYEED